MNFNEHNVKLDIRKRADVAAVIRNTTPDGESIGLSTLRTRLREYGWTRIPSNNETFIEDLEAMDFEVKKTDGKTIVSLTEDFNRPFDNVPRRDIPAEQMKIPDASLYNPAPVYLRSLVDQVTVPELMYHGKPSQQKIAARLDVPERTFRDYISLKHPSQAPYILQFALEALARS